MSYSKFSVKECNIFFPLFLCHNFIVIINIIEGGMSMINAQIMNKLVSLEPDLKILEVEEVKIKNKIVKVIYIYIKFKIKS